MKNTTRMLSTLLVGTLLSFGLQPSARAQTPLKALSYTNTADAWLTSNSWSPANDWSIGAVRTNTTTANVRLNIGTNANRAVSATYDATMGTTFFDNTGTNTIGLVIGAGNGTTGTVNIAGGTLLIRNGNQNQSPAVGGLLVGNAAALQAVQATLTLSGGNLIFTNGTGFPVMSVPYRGGSTNGGANFAQATFTIGNGSTATVERIFFGFNQGDTAAQTTGTINLNAGGTLSTRAISGRDGDASQMTARLNLNGGTLQVFGPNSAAPTVAFIQDSTTGSNLTVNVQSGGAIVDTAGFNATINEGLLDASGGGGLTKNGIGTLTLTQTNTYTGPTVVNGGGLSFIYPMSSSALTLADGTTNSITARDNSWTNSVTSVTNATINLALGSVTAVPSATTAVINTVTLNASGTNVINITSGAGITPGVAKLIDYTSSGNRFGGGSFVLGTLPPGLQATLMDGTNNAVSLNVTLSVQSLVWKGGVDNVWATNGVLNWNDGTAAYLETYAGGIGDVVNFTDAGGLFYTVNVTNNVRPAEVVLNHSTAAAVTLSGVGQITGPNGMTKTGTGTTLLSLSNSFSGVVAVNDGILQLANDGALGSTAGVTKVTGTGTVLIGEGMGANTTITGETITLDGANGFGGFLGQLRGSIGSGTNTWAGPIVLNGNYGRIGTAIGGNLTVAGPIIDNGSNYLVLYRGDGGTITVTSSNHACGGTATFSLNGAVVKLGVDNGFSTNTLQVGPGLTDLNGFNQTIRALEEFSSPGVLLNNGGAPSTLTINTTATSNYIATASIQDGLSPISLVKLGGGRQTLTTPTTSTASTYTGTTSVNEGELRVNGGLGNTAVTVASGAVLSGNGGSIDGTITINSGGTIAPGGDTLGVLTNNSTVTLNAGSTSLFRVDVGNPNLNDRLVATNLSYGGTLVVTNQGATPLTNGQVFQLVSATTPSGDFANAASVAILPGGTGTFNPGTGVFTVTAVPAPPTLSVVPSGGSLEFSWTQLNGVYRLQSQTNTLGSGLGTNWVDYSTGATNPVTVPINTADETVFFRLIAP